MKAILAIWLSTISFCGLCFGGSLHFKIYHGYEAFISMEQTCIVRTLEIFNSHAHRDEDTDIIGSCYFCQFDCLEELLQ